jgi:glyoxylase-like metal-dependent hydrolase (beta-lactamase superfamily II)
MKTRLIVPLLALAAFAASNAAAQSMKKDSGLDILRVRPNIYMISGGGGNTAIQTGDQGVLVVNTKEQNSAESLLGAISVLTAKPVGAVDTTHSHPALEGLTEEMLVTRGKLNAVIRVIVNTDYAPDQTGGNAIIGKAGKTATGGNVAFDLSDANQGAEIISHENTLLRLSGAMGGKAPLEQDGWPTSTFFGKQKAIFFNREAVRIYHEPKAQTDGDVIVFFRRSDVIVTGDVYDPERYPVIDLAAGGSINGVIAALNHIIDLSTPAFGHEGGTLIIPGHGHLSNYGDVVNYRDAVTIIRDRIQDAIKKGKSLKQVKAAKLTMDYDPIYGATEGPWTTDKFVEAVYTSLKAKK